jgi:hypothetical protein
MTARYFFLLHVRPIGSLGQFNPYTIAVEHDDKPNDPVNIAVDRAHQMGWETEKIELIRIERKDGSVIL